MRVGSAGGDGSYVLTPHTYNPLAAYDHFCAAVIHPDTGETITQYKKLAKDPNAKLRDVWETGFGKEVGRMAQGENKPKTPGKNCIFAMDHAQIARMHK